jgi:hypothetical protein
LEKEKERVVVIVASYFVVVGKKNESVGVFQRW